MGPVTLGSPNSPTCHPRGDRGDLFDAMAIEKIPTEAALPARPIAHNAYSSRRETLRTHELLVLTERYFRGL